MKKPVKQPTKNNSLYFNINRGLVFFFIFLLPTQLGKHFFFPFSYLSGVRVDYLAPTVYIIDIIIFFLAFFNSRFILNIFKKGSVIFLLLLLAFSVIFAQSLPIALYQYVKILEVLIVGIVAYKHIVKEKALLIGFFITSVIQLILVLFQLVTKHSLQGIFYFLGERYMTLSMPAIAKASLNGIQLLRPYGTFSHPNSLAGFFLVLYSLVLTDKKIAKYMLLKYSSLFVFTCLVFLSFSKTAILAYIIITVYYLIFRARLQCKICFWARLIIIGVVSSIFAQAKTDPLTLQKRLELMSNSFQIILSHPLFGVGLGNYLIFQNQFSSKFSFFFNQPVHNIFLLFFSETGILIGGFIFLKFALFLKKWLHPDYMLVIVAIVTTGLFDHYWITLQQNILLMGFITGLSLRRSV